jgi:hypothetical protein
MVADNNLERDRGQTLITASVIQRRCSLTTPCERAHKNQQNVRSKNPFWGPLR